MNRYMYRYVYIQIYTRMIYQSLYVYIHIKGYVYIRCVYTYQRHPYIGYLYIRYVYIHIDKCVDTCTDMWMYVSHEHINGNPPTIYNPHITIFMYMPYNSFASHEHIPSAHISTSSPSQTSALQSLYKAPIIPRTLFILLVFMLLGSLCCTNPV